MLFNKIVSKCILIMSMIFGLVLLVCLGRHMFLTLSPAVELVLWYLLLIGVAAVAVWQLGKRQLKSVYMLTCLFALTFFVQLMFSLNVNLIYEVDLNYYFQSAVDMVNGGGESEMFYHAIFPGTITFPAFLSVFMRMFGTSRMIPILLNHMAMSGFACLAYSFCRRSMSKRWALAAGMLVGFNPVTVIYAATCNAELIFGFFAFAAFYCSVKAGDSSRARWSCILAAASGILCGISNAFRPLGIVMLAAILLQLLLFCMPKFKTAPKYKRWVKSIMASLAICTYLIVGMGNSAVVKGITQYDSASSGYGWNLYVGASETGQWNAEDAAEFSVIMEQAESPSEVHSYFADKGIERYKHKGIAGTAIHAESKARHMLVAPYISDVAVRQYEYSKFYTPNDRQLYLTLISIVDYPVLFLALASCIWIMLLAFRGRKQELVGVCFYLLASFAALMVIEIAPRYMISYRPLFCVLAVYGLHEVAARYRLRRSL